jgi:hypothetical protein
MTVMIIDGSSGAPGAVLATRSVTAVASSMNIIDFRSDSARITGGRFFVGATGNMQFSYEATAPIALRTWEYTNGWAPYRSADAQDIILRASVRPYTPTSVEPTSGGIPATYELAQNHPNPFNPSTTIQFGLPVAADVTLKIYNVLGQEVVTLFDGQRGAGTFQAVWNGQNSAGNQIASGMYFYNLLAKSTDGKSTFTNIKKMLFLK